MNAARTGALAEARDVHAQLAGIEFRLEEAEWPESLHLAREVLIAMVDAARAQANVVVETLQNEGGAG